MNAAIAAVLALIEKLLPAITAGTAEAGTVDTIINVLETWVPLITSEIGALYTPIKNIITALQQSGALTTDQIAGLQALDANVDQAFDAASAGLDPDAAPATA